jgi:nitroreductase
MNIFEAMTTMTTTTEFKKDIVDEKMIGLILHSGTYAPSAGNLQEWEFIVVEDDDKRAQLAKAANDLKHLKDAPTVIAICADVRKAALKYGKRGEVMYAVEDAGACAAFMAAAANAIGLGFDLVRSFDEETVKAILSLPDNLRPVILMPVGWPKGVREGKKVNKFENVTHVNKYGQKIEIEFKPILDIIAEKLKK